VREAGLGMSCMSDRRFVDTNILVYARDADNDHKREVAHTEIEALWMSGNGRISYQVLAEYFTVLSRKYGVPDSVLMDELDDFESWSPCAIDSLVFSRAKKLRDHYRLSWWDCQIVAAAEHCQCPVLLSEDLSHGARYGTVEVLNPFMSS